jgi:hypothetical protein
VARVSGFPAMVIGLPSARVNPLFTIPRRPCGTSISAFVAERRAAGIQIPFIAMIKPLFKFERS